MSLTKTEIIVKNIIECSADAKRTSAEVNLFLDELVFDVDFSHKSLSDVKNEICNKYHNLQEARKENEVSVTGYETAREQLYICKRIIEKLGNKLDLDSSFVQSFDSVKIAYWYTNSYAKEAYSKFSKLFKSCEEKPVESFTAVCESIDDENSIFGVIPIINSTDGRLMSFYRLLDKYDLRISAVCKIDNPNGDGFTKFALVGKQLTNLDDKKEKTIEFSTNKAISNFVSFAEKSGGTIGEITSIPSLYGNTEQLNYISISIDHNAIYELWLYLYMFVGDADFVGLYTEI